MAKTIEELQLENDQLHAQAKRQARVIAEQLIEMLELVGGPGTGKKKRRRL